MDLNARAAYIRGLMTGMEFDAASPNGKVIAAMMDLLEQIAGSVTEQGDLLDQVVEDVAALDDDVEDLVGVLYGDADGGEEDGEDASEEGDVYEVTCPNCNTVTTVDEQTLFNEELVCPNCGATFDIELDADPADDAPAGTLFTFPGPGKE